MKIKKILILSPLVIFGLVLTIAVVKGVSPLSWEMHREINQQLFADMAIKGYDPVDYINQGKAVPGNNAYTHRWKKADWYFSTAENRDLFIKNPEQFKPQHGGYCAFAATKGFTAYTDPDAFVVIDRQLYLFADKNVREEWLAEKKAN